MKWNKLTMGKRKKQIEDEEKVETRAEEYDHKQEEEAIGIESENEKGGRNEKQLEKKQWV